MYIVIHQFFTNEWINYQVLEGGDRESAQAVADREYDRLSIEDRKIHRFQVMWMKPKIPPKVEQSTIQEEVQQSTVEQSTVEEVVQQSTVEQSTENPIFTQVEKVVEKVVGRRRKKDDP